MINAAGPIVHTYSVPHPGKWWNDLNFDESELVLWARLYKAYFRFNASVNIPLLTIAVISEKLDAMETQIDQLKNQLTAEHHVSLA